MANGLFFANETGPVQRMLSTVNFLSVSRWGLETGHRGVCDSTAMGSESAPPSHTQTGAISAASGHGASARQKDRPGAAKRPAKKDSQEGAGQAWDCSRPSPMTQMMCGSRAMPETRGSLTNWRAGCGMTADGGCRAESDGCRCCWGRTFLILSAINHQPVNPS